MTLLIAIVALAFCISLNGRVYRLEQLLRAQGGGAKDTVKQDGATDINPAQSSDQFPVPSDTPVQPVISSGPSASEKFAEWVKEDWLLKLGALLLLIGFGWLTSYAFLNNWIGPMGRIALGIIAGSLLLVLGWWRINTFVQQGGIFMVLGSSVILLTVWAARIVYDFFSPASAMGIMLLSTVFIGFASVRFNNRALSLSSIILAGIIPLMVHSPVPDYVGLFIYLFMVSLGTIWIVVLTGRRELTLAALIIVIVYSAPHLAGLIHEDRGTLLMIAYAFSVLFFITNISGILKLRDKDAVPDLVTAAISGLWLLAWILIAAQDEWQTLILSAWMVVFAVSAFAASVITGRKEPFYVYAGIGAGYLATATAVQLDGAALTIAYTIETTIVVLVAYFILQDFRITKKLAYIFTGPVLLSFNSLASGNWSYFGVFHDDFFVLAILMMSLFGLGLFFKIKSSESGQDDPVKLGETLIILGSLYAFALLWLSVHAALLNDNTATMIALIIYTITGLILYFYGLFQEARSVRVYGGIILGAVVARLFLVDVWQMALSSRIITFFLIGAMLAGTAFIGRKKSAVVNQ